MKTLIWQHCYDKQTKDIIVPDAVVHPAKMAVRLCEKIFEFMEAQGMIRRGDIVVDPFGGIGMTALIGTRKGFQVYCVELEQKFVDLAKKNFALHERHWIATGRTLPVILQGDSRKLRTVIEEQTSLSPMPLSILSSPPYNLPMSQEHPGCNGGTRGTTPSEPHAFVKYGNTVGQIEGLPSGEVDTLVTSPPYAEAQDGGTAIFAQLEEKHGRATDARRTQGYRKSGDADEQISNLKLGEVSVVVASPPYANQSLSTIARKFVRMAEDGRIEEAIQLYRKEVIEAQPAHGQWTDDNIRKHILNSIEQGYSQTNENLGNLREGSVEALISSPPYPEVIAGGKSGIDWSKQSDRKTDHSHGYNGGGYSEPDSPHNIGDLKEGVIDVVVSSPPYENDVIKMRSGELEEGRVKGKGLTEQPYGLTRGRHPLDEYSGSPENIGNLPSGRVNGVVTSPPWENNSDGGLPGKKFKDPKAFAEGVSERSGKGNHHSASPEAVMRQMERANEQSYGNTDGQIGKEAGETYWQAMQKVYSECHAILKTGGYMAIVVKDFVRDKKVVPLCDNTVKLLTHLGFTCEYRIHAMLVHDTGQDDMFTGESKIKSRKSFFRRLAEKKGSPQINFEEVLIVRKAQ